VKFMLYHMQVIKRMLWWEENTYYLTRAKHIRMFLSLYVCNVPKISYSWVLWCYHVSEPPYPRKGPHMCCIPHAS